MSLSSSELHRLVVRLCGVWSALLRRVGQDDLARFHYLLEVAEVVGDLLPRLLAPQHRDLGAELAERRIVLDRNAELGSAVARRRREPHFTRVVDLRARQ